MRFTTIWYVRPAKAQTSLRIRAVRSEPLLVPSIFYEYKDTDRTSLGLSKFKGDFRQFPCAAFLRRETGKDVWVPSFQPFTISVNTVFKHSYVRWVFPHFFDRRT